MTATTTSHRSASRSRRTTKTAPLPTPAPQRRARVGLVAAVALLVVTVALLLPDWPAGDDMGSTHYMGLLSDNQPWNLILFMAVPVIAAETIAITELILLFARDAASPVVRRVNRLTSLVGGFYFLGVVAYLMSHAVVPLTRDGAWRGTADVVAVGFYLLGLIPLGGLTLLETGILAGDKPAEARLKLHATFVGVFLVVAHVAMIFGMLDPGVLGWHPTHVMPSGHTMPGMDM